MLKTLIIVTLLLLSVGCKIDVDKIVEDYTKKNATPSPDLICNANPGSWLPGVSDSSLISYWDFDSGDASVFSGDAFSPYGVNIPLRYSGAGILKAAGDKNPYYLNFNASENYVLAADSAPELDDLHQNGFTAMFWLKVAANNADMALMQKGSNGSPDAGWIFYINSDGRLFFESVYTNRNSNFKTHKTLNDHLNKWQQIILTWDGANTTTGTKIYVNGVLWDFVKAPNDTEETDNGFVQDGIGSKDSDASLPLRIGSRLNFSSKVAYNFTGQLDDIAIWNKVLNTSELNKLFEKKNCR